MIDLLHNLLSSSLLLGKQPDEDTLSTLLSGLAPIVADAPGKKEHAPSIDLADVAPQPMYQPAPPNPLAGLTAGLTPAFIDMLANRRAARESLLYPDLVKSRRK